MVILFIQKGRTLEGVFPLASLCEFQRSQGMSHFVFHVHSLELWTQFPIEMIAGSRIMRPTL